MDQSKRCHVFISHHHADDAEVSAMTDLLARGGYDVRNSSIRAKPENQRRLDEGRVSDDVIKRLLRIKIAWAGTVVVLVGRDTHKRPWVSWEIEQAQKQGKRIVGVFERGGTDGVIPAELEKYATAIVGWNTNSIMSAVQGQANSFQNPDCTTRAPVHDGTTTQCR